MGDSPSGGNNLRSTGLLIVEDVGERGEGAVGVKGRGFLNTSRGFSKRSTAAQIDDELIIEIFCHGC
jgi:hypothetical protein